jgi:hypothetical protein
MLSGESPLGGNYFINRHHHPQTFAAVYPALHNELILQHRPFRDLYGGWLADLTTLYTTDQLSGELVLEHISMVAPASYDFIFTQFGS